MTLTWLLLAIGLALPAGRAGPPPSAVPPGAAARRAVSLPVLQWSAVAAVVAGCVAALGAGVGLLVAVAVAPIAMVAIARVHARPQRARASPSLALALDLVAVALRAGQPLAAALVLAAPAAGGASADQLTRVGGLLRLGAEPEAAWHGVTDDAVLAPVAAAARRSAASGIRLAATFEQLATEIRAQVRAAASTRAERAGVFAAAPLGLCFLPSFVCLGIVPTVVGVAGGVLTGG